MTIEVTTGRTKASAGTELVPLVLGEPKGERVFLLMHCEGRGSGKETLAEEAEVILKHAILEAEGDAYTRLEGALKELNGLIKGLLLSDSVHDVHALVGLLETDGTLHLSHAGRAEAYLIRDGSAAQITEYTRGKPIPSFVHIASGPLQSRDHVLLSTQRLLRTITPAQLTQIVQRGGDVVHDVISELESEKEIACVAHLRVEGESQASFMNERGSSRTLARAPARRGSSRGSSSMAGMFTGMLKNMPKPSLPSFERFASKGTSKFSMSDVRERVESFLSDLRDPKRKRRAHLFLLAGAVGIFLIFSVVIQLSLATQKNQTKQELEALIEKISEDLRTADNRQLTGDSESANALLERAKDSATKVLENENKLFRGEALDLLDQIRLKSEEINNVVRVPPRLVVNLSAKNPDIVSQGLLPVGEGEFIVYDKQQLYRILLNSADDPTALNGDELIVDGVNFPRFQTRAFLTSGNTLLESAGGAVTTMKTDDAAGWLPGTDMETYLRNLYVLLPDRNQIYKYERLNDRYGPSAEYNVNADLKGGVDLAIDGSVYVLKQDGSVVKLFRGEQKPFTIRNLPEGALEGATKMIKSEKSGNFYFLIPREGRIVVATNDGELGESSYVRQYILESEQVSDLTDLALDTEDTRLYVLDEKRLYVIDLQTR